MKKTVTREDVARLANVSPTIVSYVLNNSNYVSEEKRKAVLKAVEELEYVPNQLARGLRTNRSSQFAFICDNIQDELFTEVERMLFEKGYYVSLNYSRNTEAFMQMLMSRQLEGIFMATNAYPAEQLNQIAENNIPVILYKTRRYEGLDPRVVAVAPDYYDGVQKSVEYLAFKGHSNISLIPPVKYITEGINGDDFRSRAYVESLEKCGLPIRGELLCMQTKSVDAICEYVLNALIYLDKEIRPTAFVVGNDYLAAEIIQYLKKLNIFVPKDVAIVGCDNNQIASLISPTLTTIDFSKTLLAEEYVKRMLDMVEGKTVEKEYIPVNLVIRESA